MGLKDSYVLPRQYSDAYHLPGDGGAAPGVRPLAEHGCEPRVHGWTAVVGDVQAA